MRANFRQNISGQSLIEVLVATGILMVVLGGVTYIYYGSQSISLDAKTSGNATQLATEGMEAIRQIKYRDWIQLTDGDHGLVKQNGIWSFSGTQDVKGIYARKITITSLDVDTKKITSLVSWQTDPARTQQVILVAQITDWQPIDTGGLSGDWTHPQTFGSVDLGPGNSATGVAVKNKTIYMSASASNAAKPDFFIIDATNPASPTVLGSINTGTGLNAVVANDNYAYAANDSSLGQLQVINVNNPEAPLLMKTLKVTPSGDEGLSIFVSDTTVYLGLEQDASDPEFFIIDVSTPSDPIVLKSIEINGGVYGITIFKGKAYLATSRDDAELVVVDVASPAQASIVGTYDAAGTGEDGRGVAVFNSGHVYLTRTSSGNSSNPQLLILNANNPAYIQLLGSKYFADNVNDIVLVQNLAFLATADSNAEFKILNIKNPQNITLYASFNFPQVGSGLAYENNYIYMAVRSNDALRIITSSP